MNDSKKARPKSQIMTPNPPVPSSSRNSLDSSLVPSSHRYENEYDLRCKELAEAKTTINQLQKSMRWWSDCTENWRKKWGECNHERNQLRRELKHAKDHVEVLLYEIDVLKNGQSTATLNHRLNKKFGNNQELLGTWSSSAVNTIITKDQQAAIAQQQQPPIHIDSNRMENHIINSFLSRPKSINRSIQTQTSNSYSSISIIDKEIVLLLEDKVMGLTGKLDEVNQRLIMEKEEKTQLHSTIDRLRRDLSDLHELYDGLKKELCELGGKECTESELESYAEEKDDYAESEAEENRLIEQLAAQDDPVEEKQTPIVNVDINSIFHEATARTNAQSSASFAGNEKSLLEEIEEAQQKQDEKAIRDHDDDEKPQKHRTEKFIMINNDENGESEKPLSPTSVKTDLLSSNPLLIYEDGDDDESLLRNIAHSNPDEDEQEDAQSDKDATRGCSKLELKLHSNDDNENSSIQIDEASKPKIVKSEIRFIPAAPISAISADDAPESNVEKDNLIEEIKETETLAQPETE